MTLTLLALHAHPDDEASKGAGTVAAYSNRGVRCVLVTATGGEAGDILNPAMDRPEVLEKLAEIRAEELEEAAGIIGYDKVISLGYRDSGMPDSRHNAHPEAFVNAPLDRVVGEIVAIIRSERPQVILGYDEHLRYPHPDHVRVHDVGLAAFTAAADGDRYPEAGRPWAPDRLFAPVFTVRRLLALHNAMLERGLESPFEAWIERRGDAIDPPIAASIDVSAHLGRARDALRAHRTQVDPDGFWFAVPEHVVREVYPFEEYELMAARHGLDEPVSDLFEGLAADAPLGR